MWEYIWGEQEGVELHEQQEEARRKARDDEFQRRRNSNQQSTASKTQPPQQQQQQPQTETQSPQQQPGQQQPKQQELQEQEVLAQQPQERQTASSPGQPLQGEAGQQPPQPAAASPLPTQQRIETMPNKQNPPVATGQAMVQVLPQLQEQHQQLPRAELEMRSDQPANVNNIQTVPSIPSQYPSLDVSYSCHISLASHVCVRFALQVAFCVQDMFRHGAS